MNAYFISGLGADKKVFCHIQLPVGYKAIHLDWIPPQAGESLQGYALRLAERIDKTKPFILIGLSMGGMMATEIAKVLSPLCLVLISSVPSYHNLPFYYRWAGKLGLHKIVPINFFLHASLFKRLFSTETGEDKRMLRAMIRRADPKFIRWSLQAILEWKGEKATCDVLHIHGTGDLILPCRFIKPTHTIKGAGHLMVINRAAQINQVLSQFLSRYGL